MGIQVHTASVAASNDLATICSDHTCVRPEREQCPKRVLLLLQPSNKKGVLSKYLSDHTGWIDGWPHDEGIIGLSVEVADLSAMKTKPTATSHRHSPKANAHPNRPTSSPVQIGCRTREYGPVNNQVVFLLNSDGAAPVSAEVPACPDSKEQTG
jgi:hypothetical protein